MKRKKYAEGGTTTAKPEAPKPASSSTLGKLLLGGFGLLPELIRSGASLNPMKYVMDQEEMRKKEEEERQRRQQGGMRKGGKVSSASSRADGIAQRGKTRGRFV